MMSAERLAGVIVIMAGITYFTRAFPFIFFAYGKIPGVIVSIEKKIPPAIMTVLLLYCLKDISLVPYPHAFPELLSITVVIVLQAAARNALLSIFAGTALYMFLIRAVI